MKTLARIAALGVLALGPVAAHAETQFRIDCGATDVILTEELAAIVGEASQMMDFTAAEFATAVCDLFKDFDASGYADPTDVTVKMPSGVELATQVQASQQLGASIASGGGLSRSPWLRDSCRARRCDHPFFF